MRSSDLNLITSPVPVNFELSVASAPTQTRTVVTNQGAAWTGMNSATKEGNAKFRSESDHQPGSSKFRALGRVGADSDPNRGDQSGSGVDGHELRHQRGKCEVPI